MYLIDKYGRQFETKEEHERFLYQANAIGQWEHQRRIPERKRLTWFHPDFGDYVPNYWVSKEKIAERYNEISGIQMGPDAVMIRSAVHSNYAGMVAMVGMDDKVYLGKAENYHYGDGLPARYDNRDGSLRLISERPDMYYFLYGEGWVHSQAEMLGRGLTMEQYAEFARLRDGVLKQFEPRREILFAGQPFQPPENYLRNAELAEEAQTGNYNALDGRINNEPPARPDLTDGQTHEEIRELAPATLPGEKPSLLERLKAAQPEHMPRQIQADELERGL